MDKEAKLAQISAELIKIGQDIDTFLTDKENSTISPDDKDRLLKIKETITYYTKKLNGKT
jgi:hypothetical protein